MSFELIEPRGGERRPYQSPIPSNIRIETSQPFNPTALRFHYQQPRAPRFAPLGTGDCQQDALVPVLAHGHGAEASKAAKDAEASKDLFRSVALCAIVTLWVLLLVILLAGYYQFTGSLRTARAQMLPYMGALANHTLSTLQHADETATMASDMMADGKMLSSTALPAMLDALNKSQHMVERLERLAKHPAATVKVSLGDD